MMSGCYAIVLKPECEGRGGERCRQLRRAEQGLMKVVAKRPWQLCQETVLPRKDVHVTGVLACGQGYVGK